MPKPIKPAVGTVKAIAFRNNRREAMQEIDACEILTGVGLAREDRPANNRQVTILSHESWLASCQQLGTDISWLLRRVNFLVEGLDFQETVGCALMIGEARIIIRGETKPCALMDYQHQGLREALKPNWRGGVFGEVLKGATVNIGDKVTIQHLEHNSRLK